MKNIYRIFITALFLLTSSFCYGEWKYIGVNSNNISFFVDSHRIIPQKNNLIIRQLQNKTKPDKWGSLSTIVNK